MQKYHTLLEVAIAEAYKGPIGLDDLVTQIFELVMRKEREFFLATNEQEHNKGNGYYERFIPSFQGKLNLKVPRDRTGIFKPLMLEVAKKQSATCAELALSLYAKGLSTRSVEEVISSIFGEKMSASKVSDIAQQIQPIREAWQRRIFSKSFFAIQIDAIRLHVRRQNVYQEACFLVLGIYPDGKRELIGMYLFPEEGAHAWREVLCDLYNRGVKDIRLVISDELKGMVEAIRDTYPGVRHQLCLVHRKRTLINHVRADDKATFSREFNDVFTVDDPQNSEDRIHERLISFVDRWKLSIPNIRDKLDPDKVTYYAAYLAFPVPIRRMIYTTNWIERLNRQIRKITNRVGAFPSPDSLLNLVYLATSQFLPVYKRHIPAFYEHVKPLYQSSSSTSLLETQ